MCSSDLSHTRRVQSLSGGCRFCLLITFRRLNRFNDWPDLLTAIYQGLTSIEFPGLCSFLEPQHLAINSNSRCGHDSLPVEAGPQRTRLCVSPDKIFVSIGGPEALTRDSSLLLATPGKCGLFARGILGLR